MKQEIKTIPKGWTEFRIDDLGELFNGLTGKNKSDFGIGKPYIPYMNIFSSSRININKYDFVDIKESDNQNKVKYGDIFFTTSSETPREVGMSSVLLDEVDELYLNSFCFGLRLFNFNNLVPEFAQYIFRYQEVRKDISNLAQGSTRFNLTKRFFLNLNLVLPPINEQKKIAEILSKVNEDIDRTEEIIKKTEKLKKGLMQELFSEKLKVKSQKLGNLASNIYSGGTPSRSKMEYYRGDIPWVKSTEIKFNRIKKTEESITELGLKNSSAKLCPKGSVLVAMYGQGVTRGKSAILDIDATTNQAIAIIEVDKNLNNLFLFYFLQHSYDALRNVGHGSNQSNLNLNIIKNFDIPKIKYKEQEQIAEIILSVDSKIEVNKQIKNKLIQLKKGLMNDLLSGEVRVNI